MSKSNHHWLCSNIPGQYYCKDCPAKGWWSIMYRKIMEYPMTPAEIRSIRNKAAEYAKGFLSDKYWEEYTELYQAYCVNRGVNVTKSRKIRPVDERLLVKND